MHPLTKKLCPVPKNGWKWKKDTLLKLVKENKIWFGKDHTVVPKIIRYLDEQLSQLPLTVINDGSDGKNDLPKGIKFTTPKPVSLIKKLISFYSKNDAVVLDYFAGSGTTSQATNCLNKEDDGTRSWILIEEMHSTFNEVLLPRVKHFDKKENFSVFELQTTTINNKQILNTYQKYSFDFFSAFHNLDEKDSFSVEGINIVGFDKKSSTVVAMTVPPARKNNNFFGKEVAALKKAINDHDAKNVLIYSVESTLGHEEPWVGNDKSLFSRTSCKYLNIVKIPEQLIKEWKEVLSSLAI
jgi:hypothetical protein